MPNLPTVSAKFIADVEGMLASLKRAENATDRTASHIDKEVGDLAKKVSKKFQLADVGKDLLRGLGIGSGFEIAHTAVEAIADHYQRAAEAAKDMLDVTEKQLDVTKQIIALHRTDEQNFDQLVKDRAELDKERSRLQNPQPQILNIRGEFGRVYEQTVPAKITEESQKEIDALSKRIADLDLQIEQFQKKRREASIDNALTDFFGDLDRKAENTVENTEKRLNDLVAAAKKFGPDMASLKEITPEDEARAADELAKWKEELRLSAQAMGEIADPALKFQLQIEEIERLQRLGIPIAGGYAQAIDQVKTAMELDRKHRIDEALTDFFKGIDAMSDENMRRIKFNSEEIDRVVGRSADAMSDAWVDSINGVKGAWANLADTVIHEIERIIAHLLIVKPFINSIGDTIGSTGFFGAIGTALSAYGTPHARGGGVEAGMLYPVNEEGIEQFKPSVGGEIIPLGATRRTQARGDTFFIDATGADAGAIARLESMIRGLNGTIERRAVAAVIAAKRAGGGPAAALA